MVQAALLPALLDPPPGREAVSVAGQTLTYERLADVASDLVGRIGGRSRVAVWATPSVETCAAVCAGLLGGAAVVPINPKIGRRELEHIVGDSRPEAVVAPGGAGLPGPLAALRRIEPDLDARGRPLAGEPAGERPAFVIYTSGTTGPPKGVLISRTAVATNLDALARIWEWTPGDVLAHALPMFHVHGLILGVVGPLRVGGSLRHAGRFSPEAIAGALEGGATMTFGVPTMYHAIAEAATGDRRVAGALSRPRLLVSGSAALAAPDRRRIEALAGGPLLERYGLTETLMNCGQPLGEPRPGTVGPALPGVEVRLVDEVGSIVEGDGGRSIGEVEVRGPNLFLGYLNRPEATEEATRGGWFRTGDLATREAGGHYRLVGRRSTDLIKTGGYRVGAGEVEGALLEHPAVAEVAVTGEPDDRLGQTIVAWVVVRPGMAAPDERALQDHVAELLAPHKRPREVRFLEALPRNEMGKIRKAALSPGDAGRANRGLDLE